MELSAAAAIRCMLGLRTPIETFAYQCRSVDVSLVQKIESYPLPCVKMNRGQKIMTRRLQSYVY